jgi:hypothetical protein
MQASMDGCALKKSRKNAIITGMPSHKKYHFYGLLLLAVLACVYILHPTVVHAAGPPPQPYTQAQIATVVTWLITGMNALLWIIFIFLSYLLDPNFIFNLSNGSFMDMLNEVWQLSRDLMNVIFALALIGAAIYTIVTANQEFVRSHIAKFLMAIILVNFSWFFPQVILDVANVTAATIYGIPSLLASKGQLQCTVTQDQKPTDPATAAGCKQKTDNGVTWYVCPCRRVLDAQFFVTDAFANAANQFGQATPVNSPWYCFSDIVCVKYGPLDMKTVAGHSAILNGLIVNEARLGDLAAVPKVQPGNSVVAMINFMIKEVLLLAIHVALFFPLLALLLAFAIRIPVLWLTMAFMPFIFLSFIVDQAFITEYPKKLWEYFLKAAFLPAMVAIPFTVGFIMINAGTQIDSNPLDQLKIPLIDQIGNFWELLWMLMSVGIIWIGVFAVLEKAGIMGAGASAIKRFGESIGRIAIKAPLAVPIIPGGISPLAALKAAGPRNIEHALEQKGGLAELRKGWQGMRNGLNPPTNPATVAEEHRNEQQLQMLHLDLERLKRAVETNKTNPSDVNRSRVEDEVKNIRNTHGLVVSPDKPEDTLRPYLDKLTQLGRDKGAFANPFNDLKNDLADLKRSAATPPTPPTTP